MSGPTGTLICFDDRCVVDGVEAVRQSVRQEVERRGKSSLLQTIYTHKEAPVVGIMSLKACQLLRHLLWHAFRSADVHNGRWGGRSGVFDINGWLEPDIDSVSIAPMFVEFGLKHSKVDVS